MLYEVAVAAPLFGTLTYEQPVICTAPLPVGIRVLVPLQNRYVTGYTLALSSCSASDLPYKTKPIFEQLDPNPLFPEQLIPVFRWIADYYHYPLGEVIKTALPTGLQVYSGHKITLTESGRQHLPAALLNLPQQKRTAWMDRLLSKGKLLPGTVKTIRTKPAMQTLLQRWQKKGWIEMNEVTVRSKIREKIETVVRINNMFEQGVKRDIEGLKKSEQKTLDLFFCRSQSHGQNKDQSKGRSVLPRTELTRQ